MGCAACRTRYLVFWLSVVYVQASLVQATATVPIKSQLQGLFRGAPDSVLACPADGSVLASDVSVVGSQLRKYMTSAAGVRYPVRDYADLLVSSAQTRGLTSEELVDELVEAWSSRTQTQMFRTPLLAYVYERGWRQNFRNAGFPGIELEYRFWGPSGEIIFFISGRTLIY